MRESAIRHSLKKGGTTLARKIRSEHARFSETGLIAMTLLCRFVPGCGVRAAGSRLFFARAATLPLGARLASRSSMRRLLRIMSMAVVLGSLSILSACQDGCDAATVDRAVAFLDAHQSCATDEDCVTVSDYCEELPGGYCGQLPMSRAGAESPEWKDLDRKLRDCAPDKCAVCGALLIPSCQEGSCRKTSN